MPGSNRLTTRKGGFESEVDDLIRFAHTRGMDLTLIEERPLGNVAHDRKASFLSLAALQQDLRRRWTPTPLASNTGGPARYMRVEETGGRLGLITPLSCNFCSTCNRVRLDCSGNLYTCMGNEGSVPLRKALCESSSDQQLEALISDAVARKPHHHNFAIGTDAMHGIGRHMSGLGG